MKKTENKLFAKIRAPTVQNKFFKRCPKKKKLPHNMLDPINPFSVEDP